MQHEELIKKAAALAKIAPQQWADFLQAFAAFTEHHRNNLVHSPLDALSVNQGRAQILSVTQDILVKAVESADNIARKAQK